MVDRLPAEAVVRAALVVRAPSCLGSALPSVLAEPELGKVGRAVAVAIADPGGEPASGEHGPFCDPLFHGRAGAERACPP